MIFYLSHFINWVMMTIPSSIKQKQKENFWFLELKKEIIGMFRTSSSSNNFFYTPLTKVKKASTTSAQNSMSWILIQSM